jgi:hypothetical protein
MKYPVAFGSSLASIPREPCSHSLAPKSSRLRRGCTSGIGGFATAAFFLWKKAAVATQSPARLFCCKRYAVTFFYLSSLIQMFRKLMGSLLSPCAWSLIGAASYAL